MDASYERMATATLAQLHGPHPNLPSPSTYPGQRERITFSIPGSKPCNQVCHHDNTHPWDISLWVVENRLNDSRTGIRAQVSKCFVTVVREQITQPSSIKICSKLYQLVMAPVWQLQQKRRGRDFKIGCSFCLSFFLHTSLLCLHTTCIYVVCTHKHPDTHAFTGAPWCFTLQRGHGKNMDILKSNKQNCVSIPSFPRISCVTQCSLLYLSEPLFLYF